MKAIILARVSKEDQLEGQSIPAQLARSRQWCKDKRLEVKSEYQFDESSTKDQRKKFEKVIDEIRESKEPVALVVETIDRLQRSFKESVILDELRKKDKVELHFLRENLVISINSNSADLLRWDMGVMFARGYVLQLSDNVKRSVEQKLKVGEWPEKAPFGYRNVTLEDGKKWVEVEPFEAEVAKKMYEWYSTGSFSMLEVGHKVKEVFNREFSKGYVDFILKNPFYCGTMVIKGKEWPHRYEIIVTKEIFDKVQEIKAGYNKKHFKFAGLPYLYRGLIRCSECGCMITPEKKKGKYIYYHCTQYYGKHEAKWLREKDITKQFVELFTGMKLPREALEDITASLRKAHEDKSYTYKTVLDSYNKDIQKYENRIETAWEDKADGSITESEYEKKRIKYRDEQKKVEAKIAKLRKADEEYYITSDYLLNVASRSAELFKISEPQEKRQLLKFTLQNLELEGNLVRYSLIKPFDRVLNYTSRQDWLRGKDSNLHTRLQRPVSYH